MKILLLRNVGETRNLSMKLYADRLTHAMDGRCAVESFWPWTPPASSRPGLRVPFKTLEYLARYVVYPVSLRHRTADVYHVVDHAYGHLIPPLPMRRTVVTCHDLMLLRLAAGEFGRTFRRCRLAAALLRFSVGFLRRAAVVVTVSQATAGDVVRRLGVSPERVRVIPHGVDPLFQPPPDADSKRRAREQLVPGERPVLLHVGNNWFYKNVEGVMRALALLRTKDARRDPILLKVGKGLSPSQRELARSLGVTDCIRTLGCLSSGELRAVYWGSDVLVFPSWWEGFGWPPLEAMASGTPVVCSNRGALGEVVGEAAAIVRPEDPSDIASAVQRILSDGQFRDTLIRAGHDRSRQFTWERAARQTYEVYEAVAQTLG